MLTRCLEVPADEVALADTIGVGVPAQVHALADVAASAAPGIPLRWHFHNTRNTGYANAIAAVDRGASALDASVGGIGGCPFAPAATGNIATEDLLYLLHRSGNSHRYRPGAADQVFCPPWSRRSGIRCPGQLGRAGWFPRPALTSRSVDGRAATTSTNGRTSSSRPLGAAAALTGLLFVAISINLTRILNFPRLPGRAASTLGILVAVMLTGCFGLAPDQSTTGDRHRIRGARVRRSRSNRSGCWAGTGPAARTPELTRSSNWRS